MAVIRQRTKNLIVAAGLGVVITGAVATGVLLYKQYQHERELTTVRMEYAAKEKQLKREVVVTKRDIEMGETLKPEDFTYLEVEVMGIPEDALMEVAKLNQRRARLPLKSHTIVTNSMFLEDESITNDLRHQEFTEIKLPQKLKTNEFIDVRINFPTGQDYRVLTKKQVKDLLTGKVWFELNEEEILTISSALVDAYLNQGMLYALTYVDAGYQKKAEVNYPVNSSVLDLMKSHPGILSKAREELSRVMRKQLEKELDALNTKGDMPNSGGVNSRLQQGNQTPAPAEIPNPVQDTSAMKEPEPTHNDAIEPFPSLVNEPTNEN
ncbi:SAF domain-containing protein [Paenibacillus thiaminolyticus]|uniref:Pilus assembly protein CpaB n=1 Tax=Paenibacillus thiaminolyticus TaxID=49283 RepID=A0A3A3GEY9_PANTH|nr:SAF domain-containing protein [Paenibacillus thiaminolyticus]RJG21342.1 pilus assembly protein CpaB [Paenibacillus thiaminolyticus]